MGNSNLQTHIVFYRSISKLSANDLQELSPNPSKTSLVSSASGDHERSKPTSPSQMSCKATSRASHIVI